MRRLCSRIAAVGLALALPALAMAQPASCDASWTDASRGRAVPVRIRMPDGQGKAPVILFSHGLGGSLDGGTNWAEAWRDAGFIVINLQHPGSDRSIIMSGRIAAAMSPLQLQARVQDSGFVLDELGRRRREGACDLTRADLDHIGMSGHSFGAHTTLALSGQRFPMLGGEADSRIKASVAFSPAPPARGSDAQAFGAITMPVFSITGTEDVTAALPNVSAADRERPFRAMPPGGKYLLVLEGANHMVFNGQDGLRGPASTASPHVRQTVIEATTLFWRWTLLGDPAAKQRLDVLGATLPPGDKFERR